MLNLAMPSLLTLVLTATPALAKTVGYFDSNDCVAPSGFEKCYENAESDYSSCVSDNCKDQNIDCINVCACVQTQDQIDCAATHCWNQVYSCAYQMTAGDISENCLNPRLNSIPFYPPPDDAPGSCSCNLGKLLTSLWRTSNEIESCGANGEKIVKTLSSNDELQVFAEACSCCAKSGMLSSFFEICPETDPAILGINDIANSLVTKDGKWPQCGDYMETFPCYDELGYTPPGNNKSANFYEPGEFPKNGTKTISDVAGSITSPISGATFTWTYNGVERPITVASADAKPTSKSSGKDGDSDKSDSSDETKDGSADAKEDEEDGAAGLVPGLMPLLVLALMIVM